MESVNSFIATVNGIVWGPLMLALILGTGLFLSIGLKFMPVRMIKEGFILVFKGRKEDKKRVRSLLLMP